MPKFKTQKFKTKSGRFLEIKSLTLGDEEKLHNFQKKVADETTNTLRCKERKIPLQKLTEIIERGYQSPTELFLGVFDQNSMLVGTLGFRVQMPDHPWVKHIGEFGMAVLQNYWNQGIGKALLVMMEKFAISIGVDRIEAKVRCENEMGIALYQRNGFNIEGRRQNGALINGKFEDEYYIAKLLKAKKSEENDDSLFREVSYKDDDFAITLRPIDERDAEQIHEAVLQSIHILHPFMDWSHQELSIENQIRRIRDSKDNAAKKIGYEFSAFDEKTGQFLMSANLTPSRVLNRQSLNIGYWTSVHHCNKGLATLVTKILTVFAFEHKSCDRIEIICSKANIKSRRVIEKCGFKFEGEFRNYFSQPSDTMLQNGYYPMRTGLSFALIKDDIPRIPWFQEIKEKMLFVKHKFR